MTTNYSSEAAILTTKVTQVMVDLIYFCFHAVESNSEIAQVGLGCASEVLGFYLLARTISIVS